MPELTECGFTPDGLRVRAITDCVGAQVVVTDDNQQENDSMLSRQLANHQAAVDLGIEVAKNGTKVYGDWTGPIDNLFDLSIAIIRGRSSFC